MDLDRHVQVSGERIHPLHLRAIALDLILDLAQSEGIVLHSFRQQSVVFGLPDIRADEPHEASLVLVSQLSCLTDRLDACEQHSFGYTATGYVREIRFWVLPHPPFLRYVVEQTLQGASDELKERTLGIAVFRRTPEYDTSADPVVRNMASKVRKRLEEYYSAPGHEHEIRISLPSGGYIPQFRKPMGSGSHSAGEPRIAPLLERVSGRRKWAVAASLATALPIIAGLALFPRKSAIQQFWAPILEAPGPVLVLEDTLVALRESQADSGTGSEPVREIRETIDPKT